MILKVGSTGEYVKVLQKLLSENGFFCNVDGDFGEKTESAVIDYQRKNGLVTDGIVGSKTSEMLGLVYDIDIEFVELTDNEKIKLAKVVSKFEGKFWSCNRDYEYEGYWDKPKTDKNGKKLDPIERKNQPDFVPFSWSKYGKNPGHVGLSYGFIQFTQDGGNLGKLLKRMQQNNHVLFNKTFGNSADKLVSITNSGGEKKKQQDSSSPTGFARRSPRVQPIDGVDLWKSPWVEKFIKAGYEPDFQKAQLEIAVENVFNSMLIKSAIPYNICSEKGLCILFDRSVQMGTSGCASMLNKHLNGKNNMSEEARFNYLLSKYSNVHWSHRIRSLIQSNELSFFKKYIIS